MRYEVVVAIYKNGKDDPIQEETVLETDDLEEAREEFEALVEEDEEDARVEEEPEAEES